MSVGLGRSKLDSKGGVVGGNIDVNTLEMVCKYPGIENYFKTILRSVGRSRSLWKRGCGRQQQAGLASW